MEDGDSPFRESSASPRIDHAARRGSLLTRTTASAERVVDNNDVVDPRLNTEDFICTSRGCRPRTPEDDMVVPAGGGWKEAYSAMSRIKTEKKKQCCYCGEKAALAEGGCSLNCDCDWEVAQAVWERYGETELDEVGRWYKQAMLKSDKAELRGSYALFLLLARHNKKEAHKWMDEAVRMDPGNITVLATQTYFLMRYGSD
eukprot:jgi/Mesvir1/12535/Mv21632-RA.1